MFVIMLRSILLYLVIICAIRFMGKRQLGELQPSELVVTILISNMAILPIEDNTIPMLLAAVPILSIVCFEIVVSTISLKSKRFRKFISGSPIVIIKDGKINQKEMINLRFSVDDLLESMRDKSIFDFNEISCAIVETNGRISFLQNFDNKPLTPKDMQIKGEPVSPPVVIISDGMIINEALKYYDISVSWVYEVLNSKKLTVKDIFIMTCDVNLNYEIVKKEKCF